MKSFLYALVFLLILPFQVSAAIYPIDDIRVVGLQRVSSGTVFSAIDIRANTDVSDSQLQKVIRDVFATGYFEDVTVGLDDRVLIITVQERPVVSEIVLEGNKVLQKEPLLDALKSIGLAQGEVFKQSALESIERELSAQYSSLGRYSAQIETLTREFSQNQIVVGIRINEGRVAKIKHINIVGNTQFSDDRLRGLFSLNTTGTWSWLTGSDKYAREKLSGDIERLKSYYLNRGYLQFDVTSTQISLSPDKETVFITVNVNEGDLFSVNSIALAGDPVLSETELLELIAIDKGNLFSQLSVTEAEQAIEKRLGDEGYSAAKVSGSPEVNQEQKQVDLTFFVAPGAISYVRRITFSGNTSTSDFVLRREMRQLEGAPISAEKLEQSRVRLQRLGLFGEVRLNTREVPGTIDQVDVEFVVTEQPTANLNLSLGYSDSSGVSLGAGVQHNNWLGSGNTFGFNTQISDSETSYSLNFRDPYFTEDGVSRGIRLFFRERDFDELDVTNFATDTFGVRVNFGYPISETSRLSFGLGAENVRVEAGTTTAQEIQGTPTLRRTVENAYISNDYYESTILPALGGTVDEADTNNNGLIDEDDSLPSDLSTLNTPPSEIIRDVSGISSADTPEGFLDIYGDNFDVLTTDIGWSSSTFDRGIFPTKGLSQRLNLEVAIPGGDLEFYKLTYRGDWYLPITSSTSFRTRGRIGYADAYGDLDVLPFFENFFAGGIGSVRGFESNSLGPKATPSNAFIAVPVVETTDPGFNPSSDDVEYVYVADASGTRLQSVQDDDVDTFGGNVLFEFGIELIFPTPFVKSDKVRTSLFVDSGNVFSTDCGPSQANCGNFDAGNLSVAAGIGLQWLSPIGPMSFSFSSALVEQPFDDPESFQFTLGRSF